MFSVDHLWPRLTHPERRCDYDNLVYACCQCNALKQEAPPVRNPCEEAFGHHLEIHTDGSVREYVLNLLICGCYQYSGKTPPHAVALSAVPLPLTFRLTPVPF
jgi:hypothetical protein